MREGLDKPKLLTFIREIGLTAQSPGRVYLVGGATALLLDIREQTVDIDMKLDPEPKAIFENIALLKNKLSINVELASPDQFLPELPGWRERSEFIVRSGAVEFFHYDFYAQTLAKILRGHNHDSGDARAFVERGKVVLTELMRLFGEIQPGLIRYPNINGLLFQRRLEQFVLEMTRSDA